MPITVALHHRTTYTYDRPVTLSPQVIRLRPAPHCRSLIRAYSLVVEPAEHFLNWQQDPQGNWQARVVFQKPTPTMTVSVDVMADMTIINPFDYFVEESAEKWPFVYDEALANELLPFRACAPQTPLVTALVASVSRTPRRTIDVLVEINHRLSKEIRYLIRLEPGVQTPEETLTKASGSCRDTAWLMVQILRQLGFAARFTSGYLIQLVADEKPLDGPAGTDHDFTDLHAWCEVYLPGAGWIGLDPTSGLLTGEGHLPLAATPDPQSAAPISGSFAFSPEDEDDEVTSSFDVIMRVTRIHEDPRVTKPYTPAQIAAIHACGLAVDTRLHSDGVQLTMGGEPTFVASDEPDADEWNTEAQGPSKRLRARALAARLRDAFAPNGILHVGQGKWYPGEQLPRWAFSLLWRSDGQPLWKNPALIADERAPKGTTSADAEHFARALCADLGVGDDHLMPAFEDAWYHMWRERRLPINVDPLANRIEEPLERARLAKVFRQGLHHVVGWALPLACDWGRWRSGPWFVRDERLYLTPGDSPMGYRLPLDSLPWVAKGERIGELPIDPTIPRPAMKPATRIAVQTPGMKNTASRAVPDVYSALCLETRGGILHVFLPPLADAEQWCALVAAVERTAEKTKIPVQLEGYKASEDSRLRLLQVTPDPGVIEVNIHPASTWEELVATTRTVYDESRQLRLGTEKFMVDGRHVGTGGGNHITVGGPHPLASPFLRRPDLLGSLLRYWHNHPSLSYLFSGLFIGPTSQAPRADEGRADTVYELRAALDQLPAQGTPVQPWLVDRILRHMLIDSTGNTHRAEFSIDKLYSPDGSGGRRGLVELRACEMPPHQDMALAQLLLVRGLISRFWREPYRQEPVAWGTQLNDRWMLPWAVWDDFSEVVSECRDHGIAINPAWFAPHQEFRFPRYGAVNDRGVELELRMALEPWHVLGEEAGGGGAVRFVDSSIERVQVRLSGATPGRHLVTVNGRTCPLRSTGTQGEFVCGVRYRAWQPPSCLHPTIGAQAPLTFDVVDRWSGRAVFGCTYHVAHPGGLSYENRPVNAYTAEARRAARFQPFGFTAGARHVDQAIPDPDFPFTLDLRRRP